MTDPVTGILLLITGLIAGTLGGLLGIGGCYLSSQLCFDNFVLLPLLSCSICSAAYCH